jgi:hypothetical protein
MLHKATFLSSLQLPPSHARFPVSLLSWLQLRATLIFSGTGSRFDTFHFGYHRAVYAFDFTGGKIIFPNGYRVDGTGTPYA